MIRGFLEACCERWQAAFDPSWLLTVDESMIYWVGCGSAHLTFMKRKPTPIGICMRTLACGITGVLLNCELCESKEAMGEK
jgi:hypothetical protein